MAELKPFSILECLLHLVEKILCCCLRVITGLPTSEGRAKENTPIEGLAHMQAWQAEQMT